MAASPTGCKVNLDWIECEIFESGDPAPHLEDVHGILVPGGFGERGAEGKILAARFARERKVPYFGICFGMQMAVIEAARSLAGIDKANSTEFGPTRRAGGRPDDRMDARQRAREARRRRRSRRHHAARRLSGARCSRARSIAEIYGDDRDLRAPPPPLRGQHRLSRAAGGQRPDASPASSPDGLLPETVEIPDHPWFIGVQFHPELKSRPFEPHPLFASFIAAAKAQSRLV